MDDLTKEKQKAEKLKEVSSTSLDNVEQNSSLLEEEFSISSDYEILECIGTGGMGTVYKVKDKSQDKIFAIKVLKKELAQDAASLKRFQQETESASRLSHPNLVSVYKHGKTDSGEPYLVMDYLEGKSLSQLIKEEETIDQSRVLDIFIQICEGLEHAHANGVIHRDIKPTNIILAKDESGKETAKLVDFGIAKVMNATTRETHDLTQTGEVFGSPHYMSPEQCLGFMLKEESDIYSLGCSMYECITGAPPFGGSNPIQLVVKHINDEVEGFEKNLKKSKLGKHLERVTLKCVEKEPENRFQAAKSLKTDLEKIRDGKNIPLYKVKKKAKPTLTKRQMFVGFGITIGAFVFLGISSTWFGGMNVSYVATALFVLIMAVSFSAITMVGIDKSKVIKRDKEKASNWWTMLIALFGGLAGLFIIPTLASGMFGLFYSDVPILVRKVETVFYFLDHLWFLLLFTSIIGFVFFRKSKEATPSYIGIRATGITLVIVAVSCIFFQSKVSSILDDMSNKSTSSFPQISKSIDWLNSNLNKNDTDALGSLAAKEYGKGNHKEAYRVLDLAIARAEKNKDNSDLIQLLERKADYYQGESKFEDALKVLNKVVKIDADKDTLEPTYNSLKSRAWLLYKLKQPEKALADLDKYVNTHPGDSQAFDTKAVILCSQNKYKDALDLLQKAANTYDSDADRHLFLAHLKEYLINNKAAKKEYEIVLKKTKYKSFEYYKEEKLREAYALQKLGFRKKSQKLLTELVEAGIKKESLDEDSDWIKETKLKLDWN